MAAGSLQKVADDKLVFKLKSPWSDGTAFLILSPHEILEKLAAIVPPPRSNNIRYHGVLAPNSKLRKQIVPFSAEEDKNHERKKTVSTRYRLTWAALLARVFKIQVDVCPVCGSKMKIIAFITEPASIERYLEGLGLPTTSLPVAPARSPPPLDIEY